MELSLREQLEAFAKDRKVLTRKSNWENWYNKCLINIPGTFNMPDEGMTAWDIMRMSVGSNHGFAWIPTPPDRTEGAWRRACNKFQKDCNAAKFDKVFIERN